MRYYCIAALIFWTGACLADDKPLSSYPPLPDTIDTGDYHHYEGCKLIRVAYANILLSNIADLKKILPPPKSTTLQFTDDVANVEKATVQILVY